MFLFKSSFLSLFQEAQFIVTPKTSENVSLFRAIFLNRGEILFSFVLMGISFGLLRSILPVALIAIPSLSSVYLTRLSNKKV
jgi:hypothetical protein